MTRLVETIKRLLRLNRLEGRIDALERQLDRRANELGEEIDLVKSSLDVADELVDEFIAWKSVTPIPENPLVSVCIPTYNLARALTERCLPSILGQTYQNIEV